MQKWTVFGLLWMLVPMPAQAINGHTLKSVHIQALKSLKKQIAVPYYVPDTCESDTVSVRDAGKVGGIGYEIKYLCDNQMAFTIRATSGGMGDSLEPDKTLTVKNKLFGSTWIFYHKASDMPEIAKPFYYTNWLGKGPLYYMFTTGDGTLSSPYDPLPESEAVKIVQSIGVLK